LKHRKIIFQVRLGTSRDRKRILLEEWYRDRLKDTTSPLIAKWEKLAGVQVKKFYVRRMKTKGVLPEGDFMFTKGRYCRKS
jgi:predicted metal-dependent hydrolase